MKNYIHEVEIDFTNDPPKNFLIKIDGKDFGSTCGVVIKSPCANKDHMTTVEIKFYANVKGKFMVDKIKTIEISQDKPKRVEKQ